MPSKKFRASKQQSTSSIVSQASAGKAQVAPSLLSRPRPPSPNCLITAPVCFIYMTLLLIWAYRVSLSSLFDSQNVLINGGQFHNTHGHHISHKGQVVININREHCFVSTLLILTDSNTQHQKEVQQSALFLQLCHTKTNLYLLTRILDPSRALHL